LTRNRPENPKPPKNIPHVRECAGLGFEVPQTFDTPPLEPGRLGMIPIGTGRGNMTGARTATLRPIGQTLEPGRLGVIPIVSLGNGPISCA
jgi:hypothetical protein